MPKAKKAKKTAAKKSGKPAAKKPAVKKSPAKRAGIKTTKAPEVIVPKPIAPEVKAPAAKTFPAQPLPKEKAPAHMDVNPNTLVAAPVAAPKPAEPAVSEEVQKVAANLRKMISTFRFPPMQREVEELVKRHPQTIRIVPTFEAAGFYLTVTDPSGQMRVPKEGVFQMTK